MAQRSRQIVCFALFRVLLPLTQLAGECNMIVTVTVAFCLCSMLRTLMFFPVSSVQMFFSLQLLVLMFLNYTISFNWLTTV